MAGSTKGAAAREVEAEAAEPLAEAELPLPPLLPEALAVGEAETKVPLAPPMVTVDIPEEGDPAPPTTPPAGADMDGLGKVTVSAELAPAGVDSSTG